MSPLSQTAIRADNLGKCFSFYANRWNKLWGALSRTTNHCQKLWVLRNLSFSLPRATTLGVIGANGAGKTTLLQMIAGLLKPTEGTLQVNGNLATLLELGSGFQQELTGRENIFVSAGLRGFSRRQIERKLDSIIAFSELEEFMDRPIKHYSSGMMMRLAFATAINVEPEILLVDEVFSVGDMAFQHKCTRKFRELQRQGATVVLVSHDMTAIKSLCNLCLLLQHGKEAILGEPEEITNLYLNVMAHKIAQQTLAENETNPDVPITVTSASFLENLQENTKMHRHGSGEGKIRAVQVLNPRKMPTELVSFGEEVTFRFYVEYFQDIPQSGLGFFIRDRYGNDIIGINTFEEKMPLGPRRKGDRLIINFTLQLSLRPGSYSVSPGFSYNSHEPRYLDWIDNAAFFVMEKPADGQQVHGLVYVPNRVSVQMVKQDA